MAVPDDLKHVIRETLENRGVWSQIKGQLTAEVFNVLDDKTMPKPDLTHENFLINELIREYLHFNNYRYTSNVLTEESGQPKDVLPHDILAKELHIEPVETDSKLPLLYRMISHFTNSKGSEHPTTSSHLSNSSQTHLH